MRRGWLGSRREVKVWLGIAPHHDASGLMLEDFIG